MVGEVGEVITVNGSGTGFPPGYEPGVVSSICNGRWDEASTWACGVVPTATDRVQISHAVALSANKAVQIRHMRYGTGGQLIFGAASQLRISP